MHLEKQQALRRGHRCAIQKRLEEMEEEREDRVKTMTCLRTIERRLEVLKELDEKILEETEIEDYEEEITSAEDFLVSVEYRINKMKTLLDSSCTVENSSNRLECQPAECERSDINTNSLTKSHYPSSQFQRLPKLSLPNFSGNILEWQTFWDTYESSIHSNDSLTDVHKFNYLKSLLDDTAARSIEGLPLTHANYQKAIDLLHERFGQSHKLVHAYMQSLLELPRPTGNVNSLRNFSDKVESYIRSLESLGKSSESFGGLLVPVVLEKLPAETRRNMTRENGSSDWQLPTLRNSLKREIAILESGLPTQMLQPEVDYSTSFFTGTSEKPRRMSDVKQVSATPRTFSSAPSKSIQCAFCTENHSAINCHKYPDVETRTDVVRREKLCFNCLGNHRVFNCPSNNKCQRCNRKHHTSICKGKVEPASRPSSIKTSTLNTRAEPFLPSKGTHNGNRAAVPDPVMSTISQTAGFHSHGQQRQSVLLKTAVSKVKFEENCEDANILMDEGAQRSFISRSLADQLELKTDAIDTIHLTAFGDPAHSVKHLEVATVNLVADNGDLIPIRVLVVPVIAKPINIQSQRCAASLSYLQGLKLAHPVNADETFEISLLIGADYYWQIVGDDVVRGDGPTAVSSKIGYFLSGPLPDTNGNPRSSNIMDVIASHVADTEDLSRFWEIESMGISSQEGDSSAKEHLEQYQENSIKFTNGQYCARLPWKQEHAPLPTNLNIARKRTENTVLRLLKEPHVLQKYGDIIQEQEKRGFVERVSDESTVDQVHYIPHHGVKKVSLTTPIRIVYDCSCRQSESSPSLNDCLEDSEII